MCKTRKGTEIEGPGDGVLVIQQLCLTPCDSIDCGTPGFPALHYLLELAQIHIH